MCAADDDDLTAALIALARIAVAVSLPEDERPEWSWQQAV